MRCNNSPARLRQIISLALVWLLTIGTANAGIIVSTGDGITVSGADGVTYTGGDGVIASGADGFLSFAPNGITTSGIDGVTVSTADGVIASGADGATFVGSNGVIASGADGVTVSTADGLIVSGADGVTVSTADGTRQQVDSVTFRRPSGITVSTADTVSAYGVSGVIASGADGVTISTADGVIASGADGVTVSTADGATARGLDGRVFQISPNGVTVSGADGVIVSTADNVVISGADGITRTGTAALGGAPVGLGLRSVDPEFAVALDRMTDDSTANAVVVFHRQPTDADLADLQRVGVIAGTRFRALPMVYVTGTREQIVEISKLRSVRSIYGNRTLQLTADPAEGATGVPRAWRDADITRHLAGLPVTGRGVTVAVLDTGVDSTHADLAGRVVQNVKLLDAQTAGVGFAHPAAIEGLPNTDQLHGHGTFVAGVVAGNGTKSGGRYTGVAPGARVVGLSAGDLSLVFVLAGFDYLLSRGQTTDNVRVVNCSFSAATLYDENDPVNVATRMLTEQGVSVVFSAGNTGPGLHTLNPYAAAPWVVSVGATEGGRLASFSSRGDLASAQFRPTLVAPGTRVVSLRSSGVSLTGIEGPGFNSDASLAPAHLPYYTTATGTSFSAPQVAGVIALMLEANPRLTPAQVKDILQRTATPLAPYYAHEAGAGMLNAHAAVLEAAFPFRRMGQFRAAANASGVRFLADPLQTFEGTVAGASGYEAAFDVPADALVASVQVGWGPLWSVNDLGMALYDAAGVKRADVNAINLPGLSGKRERALLAQPPAGAWRVAVRSTLGVTADAQPVAGVAEIMRAEYPRLGDTATLSAAQRDDVKRALRTFVLAPSGSNFRPSFAVTRAELAASLLAGGRVPQYLPGSPTFRDVRDLTTMLPVESAQAHPAGPLFIDAQPGDNFRPHAFVDRLTAAVVLVRAAGLAREAETYGGSPLKVLDASSIPSTLRGYVHVAVSRGLLVTDNLNFRPQGALTRLELARASAVLQDLLAK